MSHVFHQDVFRMCGAKAYRRVFLFDKGVLICKKKEDGLLVVKAAIKVRVQARSYGHLVVKASIKVRGQI